MERGYVIPRIRLWILKVYRLLVVVDTFEQDIGLRVFLLERLHHGGKCLLDEQRTGASGLATANDEEAAAGTGEGDIQQVEVVDGVL